MSESKSVLKICDLGSASDVSENDITPYLASRFYRAPEISTSLLLTFRTSLTPCSSRPPLRHLPRYLGRRLHALRALHWQVRRLFSPCARRSLIATQRRILFPGRTNNHMLLLIMELKGKFLNKMVKKARFGDQHFDESANFVSLEKNVRSLFLLRARKLANVLGQGATKVMAIPSKAPHDLRSRLMPASAIKKLKEDEISLLSKFVDLLDKMLTLDPAKRITPKVRSPISRLVLRRS